MLIFGLTVVIYFSKLCGGIRFFVLIIKIKKEDSIVAVISEFHKVFF